MTALPPSGCWGLGRQRQGRALGGEPALLYLGGLRSTIGLRYSIQALFLLSGRQYLLRVLHSWKVPIGGRALAGLSTLVVSLDKKRPTLRRTDHSFLPEPSSALFLAGAACHPSPSDAGSTLGSASKWHPRQARRVSGLC